RRTRSVRSMPSPPDAGRPHGPVRGPARPATRPPAPGNGLLHCRTCAHGAAVSATAPLSVRLRPAVGVWGVGGGAPRRCDGFGHVDDRAVLPQSFERVEFAVLVDEDVHDDISVVDQDPPAPAPALPADGLRI